MFMYQGEIPVVIKINIIIKFIKIYGIWMEENWLKKGYGKGRVGIRIGLNS